MSSLSHDINQHAPAQKHNLLPLGFENLNFRFVTGEVLSKYRS